VDDRLYLISLQGKLENGADITLETIFPVFPHRVFAHWYSGSIRIPEGKQIEYVHMGYASTYERDLFLEFERGVAVRKRMPALPFGHLYPRWLALRSGLSENSELWSFSANWEPPWGANEIRCGYVVVNNGLPGSYILTVRKRLEDPA
jgi:hypothetical protein